MIRIKEEVQQRNRNLHNKYKQILYLEKKNNSQIQYKAPKADWIIQAKVLVIWKYDSGN